jgi:hypothetical protein
MQNIGTPTIAQQHLKLYSEMTIIRN